MSVNICIKTVLVSAFEAVSLLEDLEYLDEVKLGHKKIYFLKRWWPKWWIVTAAK